MTLNTLIEPNDLKAIGLDAGFFGLSEEEWEAFVIGYIEEASLRLQSWVSEDTYRSALAKINQMLFRRLRQAEYYLCLHLILPDVFLRRTLEPKKLDLGSDLMLELSQLSTQDKEQMIEEMLIKAERATILYLKPQTRKGIYVA